MKKNPNIPFINYYLDQTKNIINKIPVEEIDKVINILYNAWLNGATIFVMGNGGSASTASHFAADLNKYAVMGTSYNNSRKRFRALCLSDNIPLVSAWTNDKGFDAIFSEQLDPWIKKNDVVFAFSVHGGSKPSKNNTWSQNIPKAFALAKKRGAKLVGMAGDTGGVMKQTADACIVIPTINKETITPQVEGLHLVIHHLIIHRLKELIETTQ